MLRICVYFRNNHQDINQWGYVTSTFQVDENFVIGPVDPALKSNFLRDATIINSIEDLPSDSPLVLAAPKNGRFIKGEVDLKDFVHPEKAIYVFGPDNENLQDNDLGARKVDHKVYITNETKFEFYSHVAAGIFMYDRSVKSKKSFWKRW